MKKYIYLAIFCLYSQLGYAGNVSIEKLTASASVPSSCRVVMSDLVFGDYIPWNTTEFFTSSDDDFTIYCNRGNGSNSIVQVRFSEGLYPKQNSSCNKPLRQMKSPEGHYLTYYLTPRNAISRQMRSSYGCGNIKALFDETTGTRYYPLDYEVGFYFEYSIPNAFEPVVFHGTNPTVTIPPLQDVPKGNYSDVVTIILTF